MSIQTALECWKDYIDPICFENLTDFLVRTENGEKINKILLLEGDPATGKSTFLDEIIGDRFRVCNFDTREKLVTDIYQYDGKPTPSLSYIINENCAFSVIHEPDNHSTIFDQKLRLLMEDHEFIHRPLYGTQQIGKIKGNFVAITQLGFFPPSLNDILVRVHFTHRFV